MTGDKKPTKPVGTMGVIAFGTGSSGPQVEFRKLDFPKTKEETQQFIVEGFLKAAREAKLLPPLITASQNEEATFDFLLLLDRKPCKHMELTEIAPLEHLGTTYDSAPSSYKPYDFARYIFEKVMKKSAHYGRPSSGLILLLYITAWQFVLSETVVGLLQYWLAHSEHKFEGIYCYSPMTVDSGVVQLIYPTPKGFWKNFDPEKYKDNEVFNFDVSGWQVVSGTRTPK